MDQNVSLEEFQMLLGQKVLNEYVAKREYAKLLALIPPAEPLETLTKAGAVPSSTEGQPEQTQ